jgi:hypothetical protein
VPVQASEVKVALVVVDSRSAKAVLAVADSPVDRADLAVALAVRVAVASLVVRAVLAAG